MQNKNETVFKLKRPCADCPFRSDLPEKSRGWLGKSRAVDIERSILLYGGSFLCHKTIQVEYGDEDEQPHVLKGQVSHCSGAAILQLKANKTSQAMQIASRLKLLDEVEAIKNLDLDSPVFNTGEEFIKFHTR